MKTSQIDRGLTRRVAVSLKHANSPLPSTNPSVLCAYIFELEKSLIARLSKKGLHKLTTMRIAFALQIHLTELANKLRAHKSLIRSITPIMLKEWGMERWHNFVQLWVKLKKLPNTPDEEPFQL